MPIPIIHGGGKQAPKLKINRNFKCLFWPAIPRKRRGNTKAKQLAKVLRFGGGGPCLLSIAAAAAAAAAERVRRNEKKTRKKESVSLSGNGELSPVTPSTQKERESPTAVHKTTTTAIRPGPARPHSQTKKARSPSGCWLSRMTFTKYAVFHRKGYVWSIPRPAQEETSFLFFPPSGLSQRRRRRRKREEEEEDEGRVSAPSISGASRRDFSYIFFGAR